MMHPESIIVMRPTLSSLVAPQQLVVFDTLKLRENGCHFADSAFKYIFLNENVWIYIKISLKFVPKGPINIITTWTQKMAWHRPDHKPLSEPTR